MTHEELIKEAAYVYLRRGYSVLPVRGKTLQHPHITRAITTKKRIDEHFDVDTTGVAILCRRELCVVDVQGEEGETTIKALVSKHAELPETVESRTPRGRHVFFDIGETHVPPRVGVGHRVTAYGSPRYVVAPPSSGYGGTRYEWREGKSPRDITVAPMPEWMLSIVGNDRSVFRSPKDPEASPISDIDGIQEEIAKFPHWDAEKLGSGLENILGSDEQSWINDLVEALSDATHALEIANDNAMSIRGFGTLAVRIQKVNEFVDDLALAIQGLYGSEDS